MTQRRGHIAGRAEAIEFLRSRDIADPTAPHFRDVLELACLRFAARSIKSGGMEVLALEAALAMAAQSAPDTHARTQHRLKSGRRVERAAPPAHHAQIARAARELIERGEPRRGLARLVKARARSKLTVRQINNVLRAYRLNGKSTS